MSFEQILALLGVIGAVLAFCATAIGSIALFMLAGIRAELHALNEKTGMMLPRDEYQMMHSRLEDRVNELFAERTDPNLGGPTYPVRRK